jgi:hypothetical protein
MVWTYYDSLEDSIRSRTLVYGENYGIAGATMYYRPDPSYPEVYSFNDAFMEWIPRYADLESLIYIGYSDRVPLYFEELVLVGKVEHPYFREQHLPVYFGSRPKAKLYENWESAWQESKGRFSRGLPNEPT